jgi:hypothetical protein
MGDSENVAFRGVSDCDPWFGCKGEEGSGIHAGLVKLGPGEDAKKAVVIFGDGVEEMVDCCQSGGIVLIFQVKVGRTGGRREFGAPMGADGVQDACSGALRPTQLRAGNAPVVMVVWLGGYGGEDRRDL